MYVQLFLEGEEKDRLRSNRISFASTVAGTYLRSFYVRMSVDLHFMSTLRFDLIYMLSRVSLWCQAQIYAYSRYDYFS